MRKSFEGTQFFLVLQKYELNKVCLEVTWQVIIFMNEELKTKKLKSLLQNIWLNWMFDVLSFKRNFCSNLSPAMLHLHFIIRRIHQLEQKLHCKYYTQIFSKFCLQKKLDLKFLQTQFKFFAQGNLKFLVETFCKSWCMQVFLAENFEKGNSVKFCSKTL